MSKRSNDDAADQAMEHHLEGVRKGMWKNVDALGRQLLPDGSLPEIVMTPELEAALIRLRNADAVLEAPGYKGRRLIETLLEARSDVVDELCAILNPEEVEAEAATNI